MEPGQTIYFPLADYTRASIHVSLSRLRSEHKDLVGGGQQPCWSLDVPTPPGDVWALTYHGLTDGGRIPRETTTPEATRERRRVAQLRYRARKRADELTHMIRLGQEDPTLRLSAPAHEVEDLIGELHKSMEELAAEKQARAAELAARRAQPGYAPKRTVWNKSEEYLESEKKRRESAEKKRQERAKERARLAKEQEFRRQQRELSQRRKKGDLTAFSLDELAEQRLDLTVSIDYVGNRMDQLENRLDLARESMANAKPVQLLSKHQYDRIARGEAVSRFDRAANRVAHYKTRLAHYERKLEELESKRDKIKEREAELRAIEEREAELRAIEEREAELRAIEDL
jgi:hypothetical protein